MTYNFILSAHASQILLPLAAKLGYTVAGDKLLGNIANLLEDIADFAEQYPETVEFLLQEILDLGSNT